MVFVRHGVIETLMVGHFTAVILDDLRALLTPYRDVSLTLTHGGQVPTGSNMALP